MAVWASFAGAVLLLLRRAAAWAFFVAALIGQLLLDAYTFGFRGRWQALGARLGIQDLIVLGLTGLLAAYTWWQARRGELIA